MITLKVDSSQQLLIAVTIQNATGLQHDFA